MKTPGIAEADLATTGYEMAHSRTRSEALPPAPQDVKLKRGPDKGDVIPQCEPVKEGGVRVYEAKWTLTPNEGPWLPGGIFPNSRAMLLKGLPHARDIWVRVRVVGTNGPGPWSDPAAILVD